MASNPELQTRHERLIVVSNRLPFSFRRNESGQWQAEPGSGGLVTALLPVLRHRGGTWIGWAGAACSLGGSPTISFFQKPGSSGLCSGVAS